MERPFNARVTTTTRWLPMVVVLMIVMEGGSILVEQGAPVCVCQGKTQSGSINGIPWSDNCHDWPDTTIKRDHNPSCSIETYGGGMICCHHEIYLLDQNQTIRTTKWVYFHWR